MWPKREQIYALLDDVESADEDDRDNLINDSEIEVIAEEEITEAAITQGTSLTTPEANVNAIPSDNQSIKKKKNKKKRIMEEDKKSKNYQPRRVSPRARNTTQSKWNRLPNRKIFFGDRTQRVARIASWTIKLSCLLEWKKLHSYQGRTEIISWNKLREGNQ